MMPEENFTERYATNPFNFEDFELTTLRVICEENFLGGTPIDVGKSHVQTCSTTMRSLGFDHGGNMTNLSKLATPLTRCSFLRAICTWVIAVFIRKLLVPDWLLN